MAGLCAILIVHESCQRTDHVAGAGSGTGGIGDGSGAGSGLGGSGSGTGTGLGSTSGPPAVGTSSTGMNPSTEVIAFFIPDFIPRYRPGQTFGPAQKRFGRGPIRL
jgi:hypothetical protein